MPRYAEGQIWEYRARRGEERSLLKVQRIDVDPSTGDAIFHISIMGLRRQGSELPHAPVSKATLDTSVTRLSWGRLPFPDPSEGIAEWKAANGGVFAISVAEIVELGDFD